MQFAPKITFSSVPLLSVLKALLEDPHQAFGNLTEAYEMWSVACIVFKGGELNGDIQ